MLQGFVCFALGILADQRNLPGLFKGNPESPSSLPVTQGTGPLCSGFPIGILQNRIGQPSILNSPVCFPLGSTGSLFLLPISAWGSPLGFSPKAAESRQRGGVRRGDPAGSHRARCPTATGLSLRMCSCCMRLGQRLEIGWLCYGTSSNSYTFAYWFVGTP